MHPEHREARIYAGDTAELLHNMTRDLLDTQQASDVALCAEFLKSEAGGGGGGGGRRLHQADAPPESPQQTVMPWPGPTGKVFRASRCPHSASFSSAIAKCGGTRDPKHGVYHALRYDTWWVGGVGWGGAGEEGRGRSGGQANVCNSHFGEGSGSGHHIQSGISCTSESLRRRADAAASTEDVATWFLCDQTRLPVT